MGSSRNSSSSELPERAAAVLAPAIFPGAHLALGLSGGVDSVALLSVLLELAPALKVSLRAVHVNHGISPNAARWAEFCTGLCARSGIALQLEAVDIGPYRNLGLEGAARRARREVFARVDADFIVLAQHRDDQAETLLLRLLRGAGARGLAAMSPLKSLAGARSRLLRPLLAVSRAEIESYARLRGLEWVEDESNADTIRRRNFLRHQVFPLLERQFPAARASTPSGPEQRSKSVRAISPRRANCSTRWREPTWSAAPGLRASMRGIYCSSVTLAPRTSYAIGAKRAGSSHSRRRGSASCCAN